MKKPMAYTIGFSVSVGITNYNFRRKAPSPRRQVPRRTAVLPPSGTAMPEGADGCWIVGIPKTGAIMFLDRVSLRFFAAATRDGAVLNFKGRNFSCGFTEVEGLKTPDAVKTTGVSENRPTEERESSNARSFVPILTRAAFVVLAVSLPPEGWETTAPPRLSVLVI